MTDQARSPRPAHRVMVSSSFTDLQEHRKTLFDTILAHGLKPCVMEYSVQTPGVDLIESSLRMVRDSWAYVLIIGHKYGQTPECLDLNPRALSITELKFYEAQRLARHMLLFIMDDQHPVRRADVEIDPVKLRKLAAFRERVKVHRVYNTFLSLQDFKDKAGPGHSDVEPALQ